MKIIKVLLVIHALMMILQLFQKYEPGTNSNPEDGYTNYTGLNLISVVIACKFTTFDNSLLLIVIENNKFKALVIGSINFIFLLALLENNFIFTDISLYTRYCLIVFLVFVFCMEPLFNYSIYMLVQEI